MRNFLFASVFVLTPVATFAAPSLSVGTNFSVAPATIGLTTGHFPGASFSETNNNLGYSATVTAPPGFGSSAYSGATSNSLSGAIGTAKAP